MVGGYNDKITGGEDWDLTDRVSRLQSIGRINEFIFHNEGRIKLGAALQKRRYYNKGFVQYYSANSSGPAKSPVASVLRYYKLYFSKPHRLFKNPFYGVGMLFMKTCEFGTGALSLLSAKQQTRETVQ